MPPRIVSTRVISEDKLRATAAVSTGKLETPGGFPIRSTFGNKSIVVPNDADRIVELLKEG